MPKPPIRFKCGKPCRAGLDFQTASVACMRMAASIASRILSRCCSTHSVGRMTLPVLFAGVGQPVEADGVGVRNGFEGAVGIKIRTFLPLPDNPRGYFAGVDNQAFRACLFAAHAVAEFELSGLLCHDRFPCCSSAILSSRRCSAGWLMAWCFGHVWRAGR